MAREGRLQTSKAIKRLGHVGNLVGIIVPISVAAHLVVTLGANSAIFQIRFLYASNTLRRASLAVGFILLALGGVAASISHEAFKRAVTQDEHVNHIVKDGAFRLVRHPFYLSLIVICFSLVLLFGSYLVLGSSIVAAIILVGQAREEERILSEEFGEEYLVYQRTTGMFFPKILGK